jgi:hypothetical protein
MLGDAIRVSERRAAAVADAAPPDWLADALI